jgi:hypothetical protein
LIAPKSGSKPLSFELRRAFREDVFHIKVEGQGSRVEIQSETAEILDGNLLQSTGTGAEHIVNVRLF